MTRPRSGEPGRSGRDEAAVERVQHGVELVGGAGQPGHDLGGGEREHLLHLRVVVQRGRGGRVPAGVLHLLDELAGLLLDGVDGAERASCVAP